MKNEELGNSGGCPRECLDALEELLGSRAAANSQWDRCVQLGIEVRVQASARFPSRLINVSQAPALLFLQGTLPESSLPTVAFVGSRRATGVGRAFAFRVAAELAELGVVIVSGLASASILRR